jgi:hypothetical protein
MIQVENLSVEELYRLAKRYTSSELEKMSNRTSSWWDKAKMLVKTLSLEEAKKCVEEGVDVVRLVSIAEVLSKLIEKCPSVRPHVHKLCKLGRYKLRQVVALPPGDIEACVRVLETSDVEDFLKCVEKRKILRELLVEIPDLALHMDKLEEATPEQLRELLRYDKAVVDSCLDDFVLVEGSVQDLIKCVRERTKPSSLDFLIGARVVQVITKKADDEEVIDRIVLEKDGKRYEICVQEPDYMGICREY